MGKEPEHRTQHYNMKKDQITTTAEKEDNKDFTAMQQEATTTAEKEDGTDSTANKATTTNEPTTSMAAKEDDADSTARIAGSNSPGEQIHERTETNGSNKFCISGVNKSEEERISKGQEGNKIKTNSWNSYDKAKIGEYVLSWSPKKREGKKRTKWIQQQPCHG